MKLLPKINIFFVSWFSSTCLNDVEHKEYGKHKVTPQQLKYCQDNDYINRLYNKIKLEFELGNLTEEHFAKHSKRI